MAYFPIKMDVERVATQHREVVEKLDGVVYEAHKDATFSIIWEQHRTTAAVVAGFRSLEDAIGRMSSRLNFARASLGSTLADLNATITQTIGGAGLPLV